METPYTRRVTEVATVARAVTATFYGCFTQTLHAPADAGMGTLCTACYNVSQSFRARPVPLDEPPLRRTLSVGSQTVEVVSGGSGKLKTSEP